MLCICILYALSMLYISSLVPGSSLLFLFSFTLIRYGQWIPWKDQQVFRSLYDSEGPSTFVPTEDVNISRQTLLKQEEIVHLFIFSRFGALLMSLLVSVGLTQNRLKCPRSSEWRNMSRATVWIIDMFLTVFGHQWRSMAQKSNRQYL